MKTDERRADEESKKDNKQETGYHTTPINIVAAAKVEQE